MSETKIGMDRLPIPQVIQSGNSNLFHGITPKPIMKPGITEINTPGMATGKGNGRKDIDRIMDYHFASIR